MAKTHLDFQNILRFQWPDHISIRIKKNYVLPGKTGLTDAEILENTLFLPLNQTQRRQL
jgi:hypothetical protein